MLSTVPPVTIAVIGAGSRGTGYAEYALTHPDSAKIVGAAEPREHFRNHIQQRHAITPNNVFADWRAAARRDKFADAVIIATQDRMHVQPAVAFAKKGYHILLEKPMAPNAKDCQRIVAAAQAAGIILAVCHVMRYTVYTRKLKEIVDSGRIGKIVSMQHLEPVGYWHIAHSFVRGNWRNEMESSPMLLAKSCHDLDWIRHIMGRRCTRVSSFGNRFHFRKECKPPQAGGAIRCVECSYEPECPYSAIWIYIKRAKEGHFGWPVDVVTTDHTPEGVEKAIQEGPYGRCVYECDNDVVDHQVVNMLFEDGGTAAFTMTGFNEQSDRITRVFGTRGQILGNGNSIEIYDFLTHQRETIDVNKLASDITGGHGGGDTGIMDCFTAAAADNSPERVLSGPAESLETHLMVFAAETARLKNRVVSL